ncbi:MAG: hypothetical protein HKM23_05295 [Nitrosopumilus sp.]|nr:hypothetical protein [Nitrosopumilus sp.]NNL59522.1 hypothetical protein [Nitrosopumilus sp.]
MKIANIPIIAGTIIGIFGIVFHLQGYAVVGPESSFMYSNPDWITYGMQIAIVGAIIIAGGIGMSFYKKD